jgi:hypothetical protein
MCFQIFRLSFLTRDQIGRTSALVLTLSGVLKDILLVLASMVVFGDPVSGLQAFGYSIALGGLTYYKLGGEKIRGYVAEGQRSWAEYGQRSPVMQRVILVGLAVLLLFVLFGGGGSGSLDYGRLKDVLGDRA